jgi:hypothetical protein
VTVIKNGKRGVGGTEIETKTKTGERIAIRRGRETGIGTGGGIGRERKRRTGMRIAEGRGRGIRIVRGGIRRRRGREGRSERGMLRWRMRKKGGR